MTSFSYGEFAYVYDELMKDVPYDQWVEYAARKLQENGLSAPSILDIGCGTGEVSVRLAKAGYDVTGVDLSDDMLTVAQDKAQGEGVQLSLFQQDMSQLELPSSFDCAVIFCDSLNYLETEDQVKGTFKSVYDHLEPGGLLLFDVHSLYKVNHVFGENTFTYNEEELSYIWSCFQGEHPNSVEHDLTFFVYDERKDAYDRFDELHKQRTYSVDTYKQWLTEAGFSTVETTADFTNDSPTDKAERILFCVQK